MGVSVFLDAGQSRFDSPLDFSATFLQCLCHEPTVPASHILPAPMGKP
jgi:hypothetical protein